MLPDSFWQMFGSGAYLAGGVACALAAGWVWVRGDRDRADRTAIAVALVLTAAWCALISAFGPVSPFVSGAELARNLGWIFAVYCLFANDNRHVSQRPIRWLALTLGLVECLQLVLLAVALRLAITPELAALTFEQSMLLRTLVAVGALVLMHNAYVGAGAGLRRAMRWTAGALAALWAFELNYHTVAWLSGSLSPELSALRGLLMVAIAVPLALGSMQSAAALRFKPSRKVTFQSLSLLAIGAYLLLMATIAQSLDLMGNELGRLAQVGITFAALALALIWLPSRRLRGWLRVTALKHLFQHRYDYRSEWLRFTRTIGQLDEESASLHQRAVQAIADITDSPRGLLLVPGENGTLELAARWNWPEPEVPHAPFPPALLHRFETEQFMLDIDEARKRLANAGGGDALPAWLADNREAWAVVPLIHFDRLTGAIVLARPADPRELDWEDFDLLRIAGQQLASYLAEQAGQHALLEAARFDEFNRRIAFVIHDIKNLASQMALLARNAEKHADNPDFRADMLVTLRSSADKLNALLTRLNRYGTSEAPMCEPVALEPIVRRVVEQLGKGHPVKLLRSADLVVRVDSDDLEQALVHLLQNSVDASAPDSPVFVEIGSDGVRGWVQIVDSGSGMSAEFVRNGLFKPFVSSKPAGFGIGAFEAREMIRAMGGRLDVESREGIGSRFAVSFPLAAVVELISGSNLTERSVTEQNRVAS